MTNTGDDRTPATNPVNYSRFEQKTIYNFLTGHGKSEDGTLWEGAKKDIVYFGGLIYEASPIGAGVDAIKTAWASYKNKFSFVDLN